MTLLDGPLYHAAVEGDYDKFMNEENIHEMLTLKRNSILHVHMTSTISEEFVNQILLKCEGRLLEHKNQDGETIIHLAARHGHASLVGYLIDMVAEDIRGFTRAQNYKDGETALHEAVRFQHVQVVTTLLEKDDRLSDVANTAGETPLFLASELGYLEIMREIMKKGVSPSYVGPNGRTALHVAAIINDIGMANDLLDCQHLTSAIKVADDKGRAPLHYAVKHGNQDLTNKLLNEDSAFMQDQKGRTALLVAAYHGHVDIMEVILQRYQRCSLLRDNKGRNLLHYAVYSKKNPFIKATVDKVLFMPSLSNLYNEKDVDGNTPFHYHAESETIVESFVLHPGVDKQARNDKGQTALDIAYAQWPKRDVRMLVHALKEVGARRGQRKVEKPIIISFSPKAKENLFLVAALIASLSFAVLFAPPGGHQPNGEHKGSAIMRDNIFFKLFTLFDMIALVESLAAAFIISVLSMQSSKLDEARLSTLVVMLLVVAFHCLYVTNIFIAIVVVGPSTNVGVVCAIGMVNILLCLYVARVLVKGSVISFREEFLRVWRKCRGKHKAHYD